MVTESVTTTPSTTRKRRVRISDEEVVRLVEEVKATTMEALAERLGYSRKGLTKRYAKAVARLAAKEQAR